MAGMGVALEVPAEGRRPGLLLRPWLAADMSALISAMRREYPTAGLWPNPDVDSWAPSGLTGPRNENEADTWLESQDRGWRTGEWLTFVVLERDRTGRGHHLCGHIGLKPTTAACRAGQSESAEVGLWTAPEARGDGIATAALVAVTGWAFDSFGGDALRRIELVHDLDNIASYRVAEKSGYAFREMSPANPPRWLTAAHIHAHQCDRSEVSEGPIRDRPGDPPVPLRGPSPDTACHAGGQVRESIGGLPPAARSSSPGSPDCWPALASPCR
jgi:RimJ/RimL family protein N-acetyltransferase